MQAQQSRLVKSLAYFRFRDSLTGQMNKSFAAKEFESLHKTDGGAVMVLIKLCEKRSENVKDSEITEIATILAAIGIGEVCRVENEAFMIFTKSVARDADKIFNYLSAVHFDGLLFAVGGESFIPSEDNFNSFFKRIKRAVAAASISGCQCAVY
ncbi:MAG: hypothetical protein LUG52_08890 [Clostridia bacterium]|nr:hypothetical protein [Clostridia bacterium]